MLEVIRKRASDGLHFWQQMKGFEQVIFLATALAFVVLYAKPAVSLGSDWWSNPNAGHGMLLAPVAVWMVISIGIVEDRHPAPILGIVILIVAVLFRYAADLAAELFVMRASMLLALSALVVWAYGWRQVLKWWLPLTLLALSIPLPEVVLGAIALPLQFIASRIGAALLEWRDIPVLLTGNVIRIPNHELFVAEACSGLRSLTALISLSLLLSTLMLNSPILRAILIALAIPVAVLINGFRVFLTGFLVFFVDPKLGEGFMHVTEGFLMFAIAFGILGFMAWGLGFVDRLRDRQRNSSGTSSKTNEGVLG